VKIRSVTCFVRDLAQIPAAARLAAAAQAAFAGAGYSVQTTRLAALPFPFLLADVTEKGALKLATAWEAAAQQAGFAYLSLGPALPEFPESYSFIPALLAATRNTFFGGVMSSAELGVSLSAVRACGEVIASAAGITPDGFTNLRFAALANVGPFAPFFPAAYSQGQELAFGLALEAAGEVQTAFHAAESLQAARTETLRVLEAHGLVLSRVAEGLSRGHNAVFKGLDLSPAPFPSMESSLGAALESTGVSCLGLSGSLAAAAFLADTLDRGNWPRCGFNGLMLPVLEDALLAQRSAEGSLTVRDLLLFSAVCGTGLDTVPLPGDASAAQLSALLLDVAALAIRLGKPLTARLMPVPGKRAGDATEFQFDFFANGRVMELPAQPLAGLLAGDETFMLSPRKPG
jgi:uncharacterized protein (UPF0210 family)